LDRDGTPWIGAGKYLVTCPAGMPPPEIAPPSARITAFATARQTWLLPSLTNWGDIRSKEASLNFQFATWGSEDQGSERVQVWLEGHEETWRDTSQDSAQYSHLREGKYTFHVRAARRLGPWGPEQTLVVRVLPPWYRTTTAMLVGLLLLIVLLRGWFVFRLRRLVAQRRALEAEVKARTIELDRANQALREQSLTDPLTGLKNRRYLQAAIHQDLRKTLHRYQFTAASARRGDLHNPDIIFFMVDIDHFKKVNDGWGHAAGDAVLGQLAEVLQRALRDTDSIVRWGGEEFLVVARDSNRLEGPRIAERICSVVRGHSFAISGSQTLAVTCSVGFTPFPCDLAYLNEASWEQVVDLADQCLYLAKRSGRNGWVGITEAQDTPDLPWEKGQLQKLVASEKVALLHSFSALSFD
jgi:diguanylate cyclase (GGDEF)-like protein